AGSIDQERLRRRCAEPAPSVEDGGQRIEKSGNFRREPLGHTIEIRADDAGRNAKVFRESAPGAVRVRGGAQVRTAAPAVRANAAGARDSRDDSLSDLKLRDPFPDLGDLAAGFVPHRYRQGNL